MKDNSGILALCLIASVVLASFAVTETLADFHSSTSSLGLPSALTSESTILPDPVFEHVIVDSSDFAIARAVGDVDGDGLADIIGGKLESGMFWYRYPNWTKYTIQAFDFESDVIKASDIDGDGDLDAVGAQGENAAVYWFENPRPSGNPAGVWNSHLMGTNGDDFVKTMGVADFNKDGKLDVVVRGIPNITLFLQNSSILWTALRLSNYHSGDGLDVGDLDGNGAPDVVLDGYWIENPYPNIAGSWVYHNIDSKWWNQNTGSWQDNNAQVAVRDVNKDGRLDVLFSDAELPGYPISWYSAADPKNGPWTEHVIGQLDYCHTLAPGDMNNDSY